MKCTHCSVSLHRDMQYRSLAQSQNPSLKDTFGATRAWELEYMECPECFRLIIYLLEGEPDPTFFDTRGLIDTEDSRPERELI